MSPEAREIARQERLRKHKESVCYNNPCTPEELRMLHIYRYNISSIKQLIKFGLDNFDDQGRITVFDDEVSGGEEYLMCGKTFLEGIILYFEQEDEAYAYNFCAKAKKLLDAYKVKFRT
ncbi:hypothetical protein ACFLR1_04020 [Bacteroidota bacterium]